jgi:hypothetical protein
MVNTKILSIEGYFERFYWHLQNGCRYHKDAYRAIEMELENMGSPGRYSDYSSFKRNKNYHLVKKGRIIKV